MDDPERPSQTRHPHVFPESLRRELIAPEPIVVGRTRRPNQMPPATGQTRRSILFPALLTGALVVAALTIAIVMASQSWDGPHASSFALDLLRVRIVDGAVPVVVDALAVLGILFLLARRFTLRRALVVAAATLFGAAIALAVLGMVAASDAFGVQLSTTTSIWVTAIFAALGLSVASLWGASWLRRIGAAVAILAILAAGTIGINADFGLNPTVGAFVGISTVRTITLPRTTPGPTPSATPTLLAGGALWANWHPPAGMPSVGTVSQVVIPNTASQFSARPAGLYLPPAALVADPPPLPLVVMMMGQPGNPDPSFSQAVLDGFAARHQGLAPIVLVADQIGNPAVDPLCLDTARYGKAETYIETDVVEWARAHLHVLQDPAHWTIAGYSNGGECALSFGAKYPAVWGNVLDISGEQYPGADRAAATLQGVFHGDHAAYEATWPQNILPHGSYPNTVAIFTVGSNDYGYRKQAMAVNADATAAHWTTTYFEVLNGGHVLGALNGGLAEGYRVLYPRLGLVAPGVAP